MGGGLIQLVAYGSQDIFLTGNPQITFFKVVYRRHTNFAMQSIAMQQEGNFDFDNKCTFNMVRHGDLVHRIYLEIVGEKKDPSGSAFPGFGLAFNLIDEVELEIGGQIIDRHYGEWMNIWCELTHSDSKARQLYTMTNKTRTYIPLQFWFCRHPGLSLPLIALQFHDVKIHVRLVSESAFGGSSANVKLTSVEMMADYIFLDTDERRRFAKSSHEYLIEQVQANLDFNVHSTCALNKYKLDFRHPVKELIWVHEDKSTTENFKYLPSTQKALLKLNGHDSMQTRFGSYYRYLQRYQHHTGNEVVDGAGNIRPIYVYSFAINPEDAQPSGTCNFSKIDTALLEITSNLPQRANLNVYATNYNVLRIMGGMGGLAFSN